MRAIKYRELKRRYDLEGPAATVKHLREAIRAKELAPEDFSIKELAEVTLGADRVKALDPRVGSNTIAVLEAGEGVDSTAFSNITGQIVYSKILEAYQNEAFWASAAVDTIPTRLNGEKIPGITNLDEASVGSVGEGMPYPSAGFGEDYIETPATTKRGFIVPVTKEAIFFDRTGLILSRAAKVGETLGLNKEKRVLDVVLGVTNNYNWKDTAYDTFSADGTTGGGGGTAWGGINQLTNTLTDWTDISEMELVIAGLTDPATGEPILINPASMTLVVMPDNRHIARRILNATELREATASAVHTTIYGNTITAYGLQDNTALAKARLTAASYTNPGKWWWLGDFRKAYAYMENWPITVTQAPSNSEAEFTQDIIVRYKCSERGVAAVLDPRFVTRSTGAS